MSNYNIQSLWDDEWIKQAMGKIAQEERPMEIVKESFMGTSSSTTHDYRIDHLWKEPKKYPKLKVEKVIQDPEEPKQEPKFFDPKELDIDD